ncbi:hypothetical protein [Coxiella burnetii]|uniref:hypothetical protein n=1 Tax=Coxiella burnetii TaxID=777 RepID=UPI0009BB2FA0
MDPPLLSTISFDEKKAVAFVYPASRFKLATIGALMNYARLMLIGLSASQSPRMNQLNFFIQIDGNNFPSFFERLH